MPNRLADAFTRHPREAGQTYGEHLRFALYVAGQSLAAGAAAAVHAVLPFLLQHSAGRRVRALAERIEQARRATRAAPSSRTDAGRV